MYKLPGHPGGIPVKIPIFHLWKTFAKRESLAVGKVRRKMYYLLIQ